MDKKEIELILQEGEGLKIEFKENLDKSLAKELVAFANSDGGKIFLGISDKKEIKGIEITNKLKSQIQDIANNCDPSVKIEFEELENVLIINVFEGKNKPYKCSEGFYLRQGPNSQKLTRDEILLFGANVGKIKFDEQINENFKFPEDFEEIKFNDFLKKSNISQVNDIKNILVNLSVAIQVGKNIKLNNAGILFFGKNISRFIRQNFITCVLYKGKERVNIIDRKDFNEDLINNYENSLRFLKQHLRLEYIIKGGGPRQEILEIPEEALKEALLNSLAHRDYFDSGAGIFVEMFDDRIEIYNKGKLLFDKKDLGKISLSRNPVIFDLFHRINLIEKVGSGIGRIKKLIKERGLKVKFETNEFFRIVFERPSTPQKTPQITPQKPTELEQKILDLIEKNSAISRAEIAIRLGLSEDTIKEYLAKLKEKGIIKRVGADRGGYWEIIK